MLTVGFMSLTRIDFDLTSIAALLTILGYSLNDTVVIYDRIREMLRRYKRMSMPDLLNVSVNATLSRSIVTHVTVAMSLLALLLFGGQAIRSFTATMMFGVVLVGTYTSVFIASPILIYLGVGTGRMGGAEEPEAASAAGEPTPARRLSRRQAAPGAPGRAASGTPASAASGADRRPWRRRLPLRRPIASRLAAVPAGRHLGVAGCRRPPLLTDETLSLVFARAGDLDFFILGTGAEPWVMPEPLRTRFREAHISVDTMTTGRPCAPIT